MLMEIEQLTVVFLIAVFVTAEIYRATRGMRGAIVELNDSGYGEWLPVMSVKIRLDRGDVVDANLNCCTACLGRLKIGDDVRVCSSKDGYVVDLPWFRRSKCRTRPDRGNAACKIQL
jgi:hypothetical protein